MFYDGITSESFQLINVYKKLICGVRNSTPSSPTLGCRMLIQLSRQRTLGNCNREKRNELVPGQVLIKL